jgi:hypothetical protein
MAKLSRVLQKVFGSSGGGSEFGEIGSLAAGSPVYSKDLDTIQSLTQYLEGLFALTASGAEPPRVQDINSLYLLITSQLKYLFQAGVPEYIATEDYYIGSICQVAGVLYTSIADANTGNAVSDASKWKKTLDIAELSGMGTNWPATLIATLAANVAHVMHAGLGADWQGLLEAAANTAVKNNDAATLQSHAASYFATAVQGAKADVAQSTSRNETHIQPSIGVPYTIPAGSFLVSMSGGSAVGDYTYIEIYTDAGYWRQVYGAYCQVAGFPSDAGGYLVSDGTNYRATIGGAHSGSINLIRMQ